MSKLTYEQAEQRIEKQQQLVDRMRRELAKDNAKLFYGQLLERWKELETEVRKLSAMKAGLTRRANSHD